MKSLGEYCRFYGIKYSVGLELYFHNNKNLGKTIVDLARIWYIYDEISKENLKNFREGFKNMMRVYGDVLKHISPY